MYIQATNKLRDLWCQVGVVKSLLTDRRNYHKSGFRFSFSEGVYARPDFGGAQRLARFINDFPSPPDIYERTNRQR